MKNFTENEINQFLSNYDYDIRKSHDARWIDQKCTLDVVSLIADCILQFTGENCEKVFTVNDIWHNKYTVDNVQEIFSKPNPDEQASNEYDKYFGQPMKLLGYSHVLDCTVKNGRNFYTIGNLELLEYISLRQQNAFKFLCCYIEKVLRDSGIFNIFENFFSRQNEDNFNKVKSGFSSFTINNTPINGEVECNRIFIKVLNPLACKFKTLGTVRGRLSKEIITIDMIVYNQRNWRDIFSKKPKGITRQEYEKDLPPLSLDKMANYNINKAKQFLHKYNDDYRNSLSEVDFQKDHLREKATHMHHIFPVHLYPEIADFLENLIALTPGQHLSYAHPDGKTSYIDKLYQYYCLIAKAGLIKENITTPSLPTIYSFEDFIVVLNTGLETSDFNKIRYLDFNTIFLYLDNFYSDELNSHPTVDYGIDPNYGLLNVAEPGVKNNG